MSPPRTGSALAEAVPAYRVGRPRSEATRLRVLDAARELLEERGLRAMTMEAIAERAGTSKVTLYRWWSHKAHIVLDAMLAEVSPKIRYRAQNSPLQCLRNQMLTFTRFLRGREGQLLLGVVAEGMVDPEIGEAYREHWVKVRRADTRRLLGRAVEAGELAPDADLELVLDALFGPLYYRFFVQHAPLTPAFAEAIFRSVLLGLATPKARETLGL